MLTSKIEVKDEISNRSVLHSFIQPLPIQVNIRVEANIRIAPIDKL